MMKGAGKVGTGSDQQQQGSARKNVSGEAQIVALPVAGFVPGYHCSVERKTGRL